MENETANHADLDPAIRKIATIRVAREASRSTLLGLQTEIDRLHSTVAQLRANLESLEREAARYADSKDPRLTAYRDDIARTRRALAAYELVLSGLQNEAATAQSRRDSLARTVEQLIAAIRDHEDPMTLEAFR